MDVPWVQSTTAPSQKSNGQDNSNVKVVDISHPDVQTAMSQAEKKDGKDNRESRTSTFRSRTGRLRESLGPAARRLHKQNLTDAGEVENQTNISRDMNNSAREISADLANLRLLMAVEDLLDNASSDLVASALAEAASLDQLRAATNSIQRSFLQSNRDRQSGSSQGSRESSSPPSMLEAIDVQTMLRSVNRRQYNELSVAPPIPPVPSAVSEEDPKLEDTKESASDDEHKDSTIEVDVRDNELEVTNQQTANQESFDLHVYADTNTIPDTESVATLVASDTILVSSNITEADLHQEVEVTTDDLTVVPVETINDKELSGVIEEPSDILADITAETAEAEAETISTHLADIAMNEDVVGVSESDAAKAERMAGAEQGEGSGPVEGTTQGEGVAQGEGAEQGEGAAQDEGAAQGRDVEQGKSAAQAEVAGQGKDSERSEASLSIDPTKIEDKLASTEINIAEQIRIESESSSDSSSSDSSVPDIKDEATEILSVENDPVIVHAEDKDNFVTEFFDARSDEISESDKNRHNEIGREMPPDESDMLFSKNTEVCFLRLVLKIGIKSLKRDYSNG